MRSVLKCVSVKSSSIFFESKNLVCIKPLFLCNPCLLPLEIDTGRFSCKACWDSFSLSYLLFQLYLCWIRCLPVNMGVAEYGTNCKLVLVLIRCKVDFTKAYGRSRALLERSKNSFQFMFQPSRSLDIIQIGWLLLISFSHPIQGPFLTILCSELCLVNDIRLIDAFQILLQKACGRTTIAEQVEDSWLLRGRRGI